MKNFRNISFVLMLVWLSGCASSYMANFDYDRSVNFRKYTSYTVEPAKSDKDDPVLNSQLNQKRIKDAVVTEMKNRGYFYKEEEADLVIKYRMHVENRQETQSSNTWGFGYGWGRPNNTYTRNYREARLIIDMVDAKTNQLVWQGWSSSEDHNNRKQDREAIVHNMVTKILAQYPSRAGQPYNENATSRR